MISIVKSRGSIEEFCELPVVLIFLFVFDFEFAERPFYDGAIYNSCRPRLPLERTAWITVYLDGDWSATNERCGGFNFTDIMIPHDPIERPGKRGE